MYTVEKIDRRMGEPIMREYWIYHGGARFAQVGSEADALFLVTALNSLTDQQRLAAHAAGADGRIEDAA